MLRHSKKIEHSIETIKQIIIAHQKLFVEIYLRDSPEIEDIIHQMIHGRPQHKSIKLYQYLLESFLLSGGGDQSNQNYYANQQYQPSFNRVKRAVKTAQCPKLATFETFKRCGYRKGAKTCSEPAFLKECPLPAFDMKRGALNHMAFSLYFFLRDVCHGDFHEFVKDHFAADGTTTALLDGFITKVAAIENVGPKLAHMALAWLFLTTYPGWDYRDVGEQMIAVDSLVHNFLHRTGILTNYRLDHPYGPRCHGEDGCLGVIQDLARHIDCRKFNPSLPAHFPRFIQYHIWAYCGQAGENICNLNKCKPGNPNPGCVLYQKQLCAMLPPQRPTKQSRDEYLFP